MTDQEINIAIAEACGWRQVPEFHGIGWFSISKGEQFSPRKHVNGDGLCYILPSYTTDLNAMHEAESVLNPLSPHSPPWVLYRLELLGQCGDAVGHATARQRAEAFLRTIGKWKD